MRDDPVTVFFALIAGVGLLCLVALVVALVS
jgi:hypothetical protein